MTTLAVLKETATKVATFADSTTPAGFFGAVYEDDVIGIVTYLLRGTKDNDASEVVGRIMSGIAYAGDQMLGGTYLGRAVSSEDAFAAIANQTERDEA